MVRGDRDYLIVADVIGPRKFISETDVVIDLPAKRRYRLGQADPINAITFERMFSDPSNRCARVGNLHSDRCPITCVRAITSRGVPAGCRTVSPSRR